jgi:PAS domain-containing protein
MAYALIAGNALETIDLYSDIVRREGLEAVLVHHPDDTRRIVSEKGKPRLVIADLEVARDNGFKLLREVQSSMPGSDRPIVVASVSRELRTTAGDLMEALGITEVLPSDADAQAVGVTVRRALTQDPRPMTDLCPPPGADDEPEQTRIARAAATGLDDNSPPDKAIEDLAAQTAEAFGVPYVLVSLTLDEGHWFKSHTRSSDAPLDSRKTPFDASFCSYVVESGQPVLVSDATMHPSFATHPLVRSGVVGTFAGAPLVTRDGDVLGSVCILDTKAGSIAPARVDVLARLAKRVANELELRSKARSSALEVIRLNEKLAEERERHQLSKTALAQFEAVLSQVDEGIVVVDHDRRVVYANRAASELLDMPAHLAVTMKRDEFLLECAPLFEDKDEFLRKMSDELGILKTFTCDVEQERPVSRLVRWSVKPVELPHGAGQRFALSAIDPPSARAVSGRYSVVPPIASTRPVRAATRTAKRKG